MWALLDKAVRHIMKHPEKKRHEICSDIRNFLKSYCFIIQATAYENIELHKRYNFLSYLIKELNPGTGGNDFEIADKITISNVRQKQVEEHTGTAALRAGLLHSVIAL